MPSQTLSEAMSSGDPVSATAAWLERKAEMAQRLDWQGDVVAKEAHIAALLQAAATYRLIVAMRSRD
jgi:hypothetical protein